MDIIATSQITSSNNLWISSGNVITDYVSGSYSKGITIVPLTTSEAVQWGTGSFCTTLTYSGDTNLVFESVTDPYAAIQIVIKEVNLRQPESPILSVSDQIAYIRARLGLKVSDFAKIFGVDRQAIYGWINSSYAPSETKAAKLESIFYAAQLSTHYLNNVPQNLCHLQVESKGALLAAFSVEEIDFDRIKEILKLLPDTDQERRRARMQHSSIRDALRRHGLDDSPTQSGTDEIDLMTGKIKDS